MCFPLILYHPQNSCQPAMSFVAATAASWPGTARSASAQTASKWARMVVAAEVGLLSLSNERLHGTIYGKFKKKKISYFVGLFSWHCAFLKGKKSLQINAMLCWLITFIIRWNMSIPVWQCPHPQDMNTDWMIVWKWCKSCAMDTYGRFWTDVFDSVLHHRDQNTKGLREYLFISFNSVHLQKIAKKKKISGHIENFLMDRGVA